MTKAQTIVGKWRFTAMSTWDRDYIDLVEPGYIASAVREMGVMAFGVVTATLDCAFDKTKCDVGFDFTGFDEGDEVSGQGWAELTTADTITGEIEFRNGDDTTSRPAGGKEKVFSSLLEIQSYDAAHEGISRDVDPSWVQASSLSVERDIFLKEKHSRSAGRPYPFAVARMILATAGRSYCRARPHVRRVRPSDRTTVGLRSTQYPTFTLPKTLVA